MRVDIAHVMDNDDPSGKPCGGVAMTLSAPPSPGAVVDRLLLWPRLPRGGKAVVACGSCGRYAGDSLALDCAKPHRCAFVRRPDGGMVCRAGCE